MWSKLLTRSAYLGIVIIDNRTGFFDNWKSEQRIIFSTLFDEKTKKNQLYRATLSGTKCTEIRSMTDTQTHLTQLKKSRMTNLQEIYDFQSLRSPSSEKVEMRFWWGWWQIPITSFSCTFNVRSSLPLKNKNMEMRIM
jgi:hypothetical protein